MPRNFLNARSAFIANATSQILLGFGQLFSLPIMLHYWGQDSVGFWLATIGTVLGAAFFDLGFAGVTANKITFCMAVDNIKYAQRLRRLSILVVWTICLAMLAALVCISPLVKDTLQRFFGSRWTIFFVGAAIYIVLYILSNSYSALVRGSGGNANSSWTGTGVAISELAMPPLSAYIGSTPLMAIWLLVSVRFVATIWLLLSLERIFPPDKSEKLRRHIRRRHLYLLLRKSLAAATVPGSVVLILQTPVYYLTFGGNLSLVTALVTARTLSRVIFQIAFTVPRALLPSVTYAWSKGNFEDLQKLLQKLSTAVWFFALPCYAAFAFFGNDVFTLWTHGLVQLPRTAFFVLAAVGFLHTYWYISLSQLLAINKHSQAAVKLGIFASIYLVAMWLISSLFNASIDVALAGMLAMEVLAVALVLPQLKQANMPMLSVRTALPS